MNILSVSSKFAICGIPVRADTYKTCNFNCRYCFSNNRKIMEFDKTLDVGNLNQLEKYLSNIFVLNKIKKDNFLDTLVSNRITWHCGGMSDPFQSAEKDYKITTQMIDIASKYDLSILFSTKSDNLYDCNINPNFHTFQFSITNIEDNKLIEPDVPSIESRYNLYRYLKKEGFKVGIRIQPFIPSITTLDIVKKFKDADYFTIEGLKIVPQNLEHKEFLFNNLKLNKDDFTQMGLLNLKPHIRNKLYKPFIEYFKHNNIPFSIADNDMHDISSGKCCCGDSLIAKSTDFNNTAMYNKYGNYNYENIVSELGCYATCKANNLFTSNRQEGCVTVEQFYKKRFERESSPFSPKFTYERA